MNASISESREWRYAKAILAASMIATIGIFASFLVPLSASPQAPSPLVAYAATTRGVCSPTLQFETTSGDATHGGSMSYLLVAKNLGTASCLNASISIYYAPNEHFSLSLPKPTADGYYWRLGTIAPGATTDITVVTNRTASLASNTTPNEACLASDNGQDACADAAIAAPGTMVKQTQTTVATQKTVTTQNPTTQSSKVTLSGSSENQPVSPNPDNGVWEWTSAYGMSQATAQQIVNEAAANHFNVIYMTVDSSLNVSGPQLTSYENSLNTLLTLASAQNIAVEAEAGASDWYLPANWPKPQAIMDFVASYNQSHSVKFRGVQFDIEPYTTAAYAANTAGTLTQYVQMAETLVNRSKSDGLQLGLVIPSFYTESSGGTPQITVDGITTYAYNHLVRLLGELPNGKIYLMAYRNSAAGANGTIGLSQDEVSEANSTNVKVVVGQETGPTSPSYVTFLGMSKTQMAAQVALVNQAFAGNRSFDGIAVDYLETYTQLAN